MSLQNKIDFTLVITVTNANPNGDPLGGNRPRDNFDGFGEISDVCIKRKIRNRLQDMGEKIFVQSDDHKRTDQFDSLSQRANNLFSEKGLKTNSEKADAACKEWIDVRSFGQVFALSGKKKENDKEKGVSIGIRGPVSIQQAISVSQVNIINMQIVKCVNGEPTKDGSKSSDTMGTKHRVEFGVYVINGSINCQLAEKTGFSEEDAEKIKEALATLFENDCSSARPEGSMEVRRFYWWKHDCKTPKYSSAKVHRQLEITLKEGISRPKKFEDYDIVLNKLDGLEPEIVIND